MFPLVFSPIVKMPVFEVQASCDVERECRGVRVGLRAGRNHAHARDAPEDERGEDGDRDAPAHSARPMTARPVGRTWNPNDS